MGRDSRGRAQEAQWRLMLQGSQVHADPTGLWLKNLGSSVVDGMAPSAMPVWLEP